MVPAGCARMMRGTLHSNPPPMASLQALFSDPTAWAALFALVVMEVVLGIDNLIFISILSNKLPAVHRSKARRVGIALALTGRTGTLRSTVAITVVTMSPPWFTSATMQSACSRW